MSAELTERVAEIASITAEVQAAKQAGQVSLCLLLYLPPCACVLNSLSTG